MEGINRRIPPTSRLQFLPQSSWSHVGHPERLTVGDTQLSQEPHVVCSCDSVAVPRPAWGSRGDLPEFLPEQQRAMPLATYPLVYVNPKSVFLSFHQHFLVISSSANSTGWNPPAVAGIARTHILCSHTQASCFALTSVLVFCYKWHTASWRSMWLDYMESSHFPSRRKECRFCFPQIMTIY